MEGVAKEDGADQVLLFVVDILKEEATLLVPNDLVKTVAEASLRRQGHGRHRRAARHHEPQEADHPGAEALISAGVGASRPAVRDSRMQTKAYRAADAFSTAWKGRRMTRDHPLARRNLGPLRRGFLRSLGLPAQRQDRLSRGRRRPAGVSRDGRHGRASDQRAAPEAQRYQAVGTVWACRVTAWDIVVTSGDAAQIALFSGAVGQPRLPHRRPKG